MSDHVYKSVEITGTSPDSVQSAIDSAIAKAAESLRHGLWDELSPSELGAALSVLVFEARRPDDARSPRIRPHFADRALRKAKPPAAPDGRGV